MWLYVITCTAGFWACHLQPNYSQSFNPYTTQEECLEQAEKLAAKLVLKKSEWKIKCEYVETAKRDK